jgi:alpha-mannosidase
VQIVVRDWQGPVGQWDSVLRDAHLFQQVFVPPMRGQSWTPDAIQADMVVRWDPTTGAVSGLDRIRPGFVKRDEIAWVGGHRHSSDGNQPYVPSYVFAYTIDLPPGTHHVTLPNDARLRILAATASRGPSPLRPTRPLYAADLPDPRQMR